MKKLVRLSMEKISVLTLVLTLLSISTCSIIGMYQPEVTPDMKEQLKDLMK